MQIKKTLTNYKQIERIVEKINKKTISETKREILQYSKVNF